MGGYKVLTTAEKCEADSSSPHHHIEKRSDMCRDSLVIGQDRDQRKREADGAFIAARTDSGSDPEGPHILTRVGAKNRL